MPSDRTTFYLTGSSTQYGAIGIYHIHGEEERLRLFLDRRIGGKKNNICHNTLNDNELRYGWLRDDTGESIDEVMIARPYAGIRVVMTHGGAVIREKITAYFKRKEVIAADERLDDPRFACALRDQVIDPILAGCVTEAQAAAVLAARTEAARTGRYPVFPSNLLLTHRLLLAGPPNAGKSSLLNNLAGHTRAFVHHEAGATTDVVEELADIGGYAVMIGDMPGFSEAADALGKMAWGKAVTRLGLADAVLFVCDGSRGWEAETENAARELSRALAGLGGEEATIPVMVVVNKEDLPAALSGKPWEAHFPGATVVRVCSLPGGNALEVLGRAVQELFD